MELRDRLARIRDRMAEAARRAGREPGAVALLAVTKGFGVEAARSAFALGLVDLGENRVQEAEGKIAAMGAGPRWHLIGHLQTNKAKRAAQLFDEIHSVDSLRLAEDLARRAALEGRTLRCYVEVRTTGESTKSGAAPEETHALVERMRSLAPLRVAGLMTMGPLHGGPEGARSSFRALRRLRDEGIDRGVLDDDAGLSMGMSDDFEVAIEEGATIVRIGSALFGPRP
ncbi:MAG TPA: YggS family pyridoxal phosphate-dependent enzyme [Candidatus Eisenbacteria bacterium]|nr:YggS family pyridoxal phosphate-dependent enzyme [Candidatus Eisenbacteria bacterium]